MTYIYYIPHISFFSKHPYGRVAHALGVVNGIAENNHNVILIAESGVESFVTRLNPGIKIKVLKKFSLLAHVSFILKTPLFFNSLNEDFVFIYRKTVLSLFLTPFFYLLNIFNRPIVVSEINGFIFDYKKSVTNNTLISLTELFHKIILGLDSYVYSVNDDIKNILSNGLFALNPSKIFSVHNGGPNPNFINFNNLSSHKVKLVFFGILADYNEIELFIDVLNRPLLKNKVELEIIGFGPQLNNIIQYSNKRTDVKIHGKMSFENFSNLLHSWNCRIVGIVPMRIGNKMGSLSPIKAFDYMSFALPLIYSDLCLDGIVKDDIHGFSYNNGDIRSLEKSILKIIEKDNYLRISGNIKNDYYLHTWKERMKQLLNSITN